MNANFEYYKVFYYVSKYENLTKAASVLKTSQPAVTRTIHNLENILGCRLFTRSKSGMKLTPEGKIFYQYVAAGCAQFFKAEDNLNNLISLENGTVQQRQHCTVICSRQSETLIFNTRMCILKFLITALQIL